VNLSILNLKTKSNLRCGYPKGLFLIKCNINLKVKAKKNLEYILKVFKTIF
jgi:hypothetical protein